MHQKMLLDPQKYQCELRSLTQHECTFKVKENETPEIICLPFKRVFQRCLETAWVTDRTGKKRHHQLWINIEVTDERTNGDLATEPKYGRDVADFLNAEKELQEIMKRDEWK